MSPAGERRITLLLLLIALALGWLAVRPHLLPGPVEASREVLSVSLDRVGGRALWDGVIPVRCLDRRP